MSGNEIWILKEKFKRLKWDLKIWNKDMFGDINKSKNQIMVTIRHLDIIYKGVV